MAEEEREARQYEAGSWDRGVEQDAEVGGGGGGPALPPQALQSLRQAHQQVHGPRREKPMQHRRPGQSSPVTPYISCPPLFPSYLASLFFDVKVICRFLC